MIAPVCATRADPADRSVLNKVGTELGLDDATCSTLQKHGIHLRHVGRKKTFASIVQLYICFAVRMLMGLGKKRAPDSMVQTLFKEFVEQFAGKESSTTVIRDLKNCSTMFTLTKPVGTYSGDPWKDFWVPLFQTSKSDAIHATFYKSLFTSGIVKFYMERFLKMPHVPGTDRFGAFRAWLRDTRMGTLKEEQIKMAAIQAADLQQGQQAHAANEAARLLRQQEETRQRTLHDLEAAAAKLRPLVAADQQQLQQQRDRDRLIAARTDEINQLAPSQLKDYKEQCDHLDAELQKFKATEERARQDIAQQANQAQAQLNSAPSPLQDAQFQLQVDAHKAVEAECHKLQKLAKSIAVETSKRVKEKEHEIAERKKAALDAARQKMIASIHTELPEQAGPVPHAVNNLLATQQARELEHIELRINELTAGKLHRLAFQPDWDRDLLPYQRAVQECQRRDGLVLVENIPGLEAQPAYINKKVFVSDKAVLRHMKVATVALGNHDRASKQPQALPAAQSPLPVNAFFDLAAVGDTTIGCGEDEEKNGTGALYIPFRHDEVDGKAGFPITAMTTRIVTLVQNMYKAYELRPRREEVAQKFLGSSLEGVVMKTLTTNCQSVWRDCTWLGDGMVCRGGPNGAGSSSALVMQLLDENRSGSVLVAVTMPAQGERIHYSVLHSSDPKPYWMPASCALPPPRCHTMNMDCLHNDLRSLLWIPSHRNNRMPGFDSTRHYRQRGNAHRCMQVGQLRALLMHHVVTGTLSERRKSW
jgi:hypothetical protein